MRILLDFELVERILREVMRGFGALPKRGAEIGGILLGVVQPDSPIRVRDFLPVSIEHRFGPSYLLSESDLTAFQEKLAAVKESGGLLPVGFVRSKTKGDLALASEDRELWSRFFPEPDRIALLIAPSASRPPRAAFFVKPAQGECAEQPLLEFSFRRRDLDPEFISAPPGRRRNDLPPQVAERPGGDPPLPLTPPETEPPTFGGYAAPAPNRRLTRALPWIAACFACLLAGLIGGYKASLMVAPRPAALDAAGLKLAVAARGTGLRLTWNAASPFLRTAVSGVVTIREPQSVWYAHLTPSELSTGVLLYPNRDPGIQFRLEVTLADGDTVAATTSWAP